MLNFKFYELSKKFNEEKANSDHEYFFYVLDGKLNFKVEKNSFDVDAGSIIKIKKGEGYQFSNISLNSRLVTISSNNYLESKIS